MKKTLSLAVLIVLFAMCVGMANADVIFDSMPGDAYDSSSGGTVSGPSSIVGTAYEAIQFTVTGGDFTLTSIELPFTYINGASLASIALLADNSNTPGSLIESLGAMPISNVIVQFDSSANPLLQDGISYWVAAYPGGTNTWAVWDDSYNPTYGLWAYSNGGSWQTGEGLQFAMRVNGDPVVPEPSSILMLLGGAGALGGMFLRRRK